MADPVNAGDAVTLRHLDAELASLGAGGDNLGDHNATQRINMSGNDVINASGYFYSSDRRLKTKIEEVEGLDIVRAVDGYSYEWKSDGSAAWGFIAQDLREIAPQMVTEDEDGMLSVDYIQMIAPMVEAIQELDARLAVLEQK